MKSGYIYVLEHPSKRDLYKVGQTTRHPSERLAEHNSRLDKYAGKIVKETGKQWELKTFILVEDPYWAEAVFWHATPFSVLPFRAGIEVQEMSWEIVLAGLEAAKKAGLRPPPGPLPVWVYANRAWINKRLHGRGISLVSEVKSKHGKSNFRCDNGHEWRTTPNNVASGEGCPFCGTGVRSPEEIFKSINIGTVYLLVNPKEPGHIMIAVQVQNLEPSLEVLIPEGWQVHRYRNVEEPVLAESILFDLLNISEANTLTSLMVDLNVAESAFRELHYRLENEIALSEMAMDSL